MSYMKGNTRFQFVATNIFVYAYNRTDKEKYFRARNLVMDLWEQGQGCLSIQVLQEFYVTITQEVPNPVSPETAVQIVSYLGRWKLHVPEVTDVLEAVNVQQKNKLSFWDALVICSAKNLNCDILWTEDLYHGQSYEGVEVVNPFLP